ncbi:MAG: hypothetical protein ABIR15_21090, partial [Chitinophagaceae bacterium]
FILHLKNAGLLQNGYEILQNHLLKYGFGTFFMEKKYRKKASRNPRLNDQSGRENSPISTQFLDLASVLL